MKIDTVISVVCTVIGVTMIHSGMKGLKKYEPLMTDRLKEMADKEAERIKNMK